MAEVLDFKALKKGAMVKRLKGKVGVIVQARMTSKRFPGKSMALLNGKPVLEHVLERAMLIRYMGDRKPLVILACPDTPESEPMLELADRMGVENFCGSEHDVLRRYYFAAKFFKLERIMRITADCPFLSPKICSQVFQLLIARSDDYCSNVHPKRTFPQGLDCEAFTMDCLDAAYQKAETLYDKEHVTPWMQKTDGVLTSQVAQKKDMSNINWCVDLPGDIARLEQMIFYIRNQTKTIENPRKVKVATGVEHDETS